MKLAAITTGPRFRCTLYGLYRLLWFAAARDRSFARRLAERDFCFVMSAREEGTARHYRVRQGRWTSRAGAGAADFRLVWRDEETGCRVMTDMIRGKRHALRDAVIRGDLLLEGDAALIGGFLEIVNHLGRAVRGKRRKRVPPGGAAS